VSDGKSLDGLTCAQREAAACVDAPVLVVAGPGSGKTRTLVARLGHLIESGACKPEEILAVTFSRKAAGEIKARLPCLLGPAAARVAVGTFHQAALLLRPLPAEGFLLGEADRSALAAEVVAQVRAQTRAEVRTKLEENRRGERIGQGAADKLIETVSSLKGQRCDWEAAPVSEQPAWLAKALRVYTEWQRELAVEDLDDLLVAATNAVRRGEARRRFRFIQVDEYQDVNGVQRELLLALAATGARLFAIGDPDQAIYGFRGADVAHFHSFASDFAGARRFFLRDNFRATSVLVTASTAVIVRNQDRLEGPAAKAFRPSGERLVVNAAVSAVSEAIGVARQIERLVGGTSLSSHDQGRTAAWAAGRYGFSDIAVLTRTVARADRIAEALHHEGVPILRPRRKSLTADTSPELLRRLAALLPGTKEQEAEKAAAAEAAKLPPELAFVPENPIGLFHESDEWDERMQRVAVLTLHGSKGLEFPVVFLCGCEAELLPGIAADAAETVEERRLFYVGLTRAKDLLYLSHIEGRPRSPFLDELPAELLAVPPRPAPRKPRPPQLKLF
jgi:superfamily I DNA/RNA helicase